MEGVVKVHGEEHVILEQRGSIFNPRFIGRSIETGRINKLKLNRKGLIKYYWDLALQSLLCFGYFALFILYLAVFG